MDIEPRVLLVTMAILFVVGMAIFLLWKLFEPKREGETRSMMHVLVEPAAVMAGGVTFIAICMVFPQVLSLTFGVLAVLAIIAFFRMPAREKQAIADTFERPYPQSKWFTARLLLAAAIVLGAFFGLLEYFATKVR